MQEMQNDGKEMGIMVTEKKRLFSEEDLRKLLLPLMVEQFLMVAMGMADTFMVASCGESAVSGISLVDTLAILLIGVLNAMASGGAVVAAQFMGKGDKENVGKASKQLFLMLGVSSILLMLVSLIWNHQLLQLIYGEVEPAIMEAARIYFYFTALSLPFLAIYSGGAALFRAVGNSKISMKVSMLANILNVAGNALFIYGFQWGVRGAALSTFVSRVVSAVLISLCLRKTAIFKMEPGLLPDFSMLRKILYIGVPNGVENSIFQVGKLLLSSLLASFGTVAITANAVTNSIGSFQQIPNNAISIAMITVVGQAVGADDEEQALYYTKKLMKQACYYMIVLGIVVFFAAKPVTEWYHLSRETTELTIWLLRFNSIASMLLVPLAFTLPVALRAAGDVRYNMVVSIGCMWVCRIGLAYVLADYFGLGIKGIWFAMTIDWVVRTVFYLVRVHSGKWLMHKDKIVRKE